MGVCEKSGTADQRTRRRSYFTSRAACRCYATARSPILIVGMIPPPPQLLDTTHLQVWAGPCLAFTLSCSNLGLAVDRSNFFRRNAHPPPWRTLRFGCFGGRKPTCFASFIFAFVFAFAFISYLMEIAHFIPLRTCLGRAH
jgi:hypothetical protein